MCLAGRTNSLLTPRRRSLAGVGEVLRYRSLGYVYCRLKREVAKMASVDATRIALEVMGKPFTNTPMLGALVRAVGFVDLNSIFQAVRERFPERVAEANVESIKRAYGEVRIG